MTGVETFQSLAYLSHSSDVRILRLYWFWLSSAYTAMLTTGLLLRTAQISDSEPQPSKHTFSKPLKNLSVSHFHTQKTASRLSKGIPAYLQPLRGMVTDNLYSSELCLHERKTNLFLRQWPQPGYLQFSCLNEANMILWVVSTCSNFYLHLTRTWRRTEPGVSMLRKHSKGRNVHRQKKEEVKW